MRLLTGSLRTRLDRSPWWAWTSLGLLGSLVIALGASSVGSLPRPSSYRWWLPTPVHSHTLGYGVLYVGVGLLVVAWLALGVLASREHLGLPGAMFTLITWSLPLFFAAPIFSRDVYSYIAQGLLAHHGLNPYHVGATALNPGPLFDSLSVVWRSTPAPYGPLFVTLSNAVTGVAHSLIGQVLIFRLLSGLALLSIALTLYYLARDLGRNGSLAVWLGALSPLSLFSLVSSAHNDSLMIALVLGGLLAWRRGHLHLSIVLIALGAAVKLPALAALTVIAIAEVRRHRSPARLLIEIVAVVGAVLSALTLFNGFGWWWASPQALELPSQLRTIITPTTSLGVFLAACLRVLGLHTLASHRVVTWVQRVGEVVVSAGVIYALWRARAANALRVIGIILLALVIGGPTIWPWYLLWGITVLAVTSAQTSGFLVLLAALASLIVGPGGSPMMAGNSYLVLTPLYVASGIGFVRYARRHDILAPSDDEH